MQNTENRTDAQAQPFDVQHRDCFDSLAAMRDAGGADLILTSPPYPDARKPEAYGAEFDTSLAGYRRLGDAVFAALKPGGVCALNIDGPVRKWRGEDIGSERSLIAFEVALDWAKRVGFRYVERCVYGRLGQPGDFGPRWRSGHELVHVFARPGAPVVFDAEGSKRRATTVGVASGKSSGRSKGSGPSNNKGSHIQGSHRRLATCEMHLAGTAGGQDCNHPASFAPSLADDYVLCYSPPGGLVGDPFAGSGTVPFSVHRAGDGRRFIGGDLGIRQRDGARWADVVNDGLRQGRLFS